jgi:hypothetical protein
MRKAYQPLKWFRTPPAAAFSQSARQVDCRWYEGNSFERMPEELKC